MTEPVVCAVGSTESHLAVGLGVALRVLAEWGARAVAVVAAVSAQDARGVRALAPLPPELIRAQFDSLADTAIDAVCIGALADEASAEAIVESLALFRGPLIYDPVAASSAGGAFAATPQLRAISDRLLTLGAIITPNLAEASVLTDVPVHSVETMIQAGRVLIGRGARAVLVKGGHLSGAPQDVLVDGTEVHVFSNERLPQSMRATGCVLAASLAAALALGAPLPSAVERARAFVREKIAHAREIAGMRIAY